MIEIIIGVLTIVVSFIGGVVFDYLNWPDASTVVAIAFIGSIILWYIRHNKQGDGS